MDFEKLAPARRTIRRFRQQMIPDEELLHLVDMARHASCAVNLQPLTYVIAKDQELVRNIFEGTAWGGLVSPRRNPVWGESAPPVFIAVTAPANAGGGVLADAGAAIQMLELAAWEKNIGCCWLGSFKPETVKKLLELDDDRKVLYLVAAGYPAESPVGEDAKDGKTAYYLDENDVLHVPKRPVNEIVIWK